MDNLPVHGGYPDARKAPVRGKPIHLQIAAASDEHEMWARRWRWFRMRCAAETVKFADRDGPWDAQQLLAYMGKASGFDA